MTKVWESNGQHSTADLHSGMRLESQQHQRVTYQKYIRKNNLNWWTNTEECHQGNSEDRVGGATFEAKEQRLKQRIDVQHLEAWRLKRINTILPPS